jgi:hypothetical protein
MLSCLLCTSPVTTGPTERDATLVHCSRCGTYALDGLAEAALRNGAWEDERPILAGVVRNTRKRGATLELTSENIPTFISSAPVPKSPADVAEIVLLDIAETARNNGAFSADVNVGADAYIEFFLRDQEDLFLILSALENRGLIRLEEEMGETATLSLTLAGWERIDALRTRIPSGFRAFVAMAFTPELEQAWLRGIRPALEATGYVGVRMDEIQHNEKIDDRIVAELRQCGLIISDFTLHKQNVYFECGYAMGRGVPVIWCCRKDEIGKAHFDTRQYNHVTWETPEELRERLVNRIKATLPIRYTGTGGSSIGG